MGEAVLAPLHAAADQGHLNVVRFLLDHGADLELPRERPDEKSAATRHFAGAGGATALWLACRSGHVSTAALLVSRGAKLEAADDWGWSPLHAAGFGGHEETVRLLLEQGVQVDPIDRGCSTPLLLACVQGYSEVVRLLHGARANLVCTRKYKGKQMTPFEAAYDNGRSEVVAYLREAATTPLGPNQLGRSGRVMPPSTEPPGSPPSKQSRPKRLTPIRARAEKAGVGDKLQATPPGVRDVIASGLPSSSPVKAAKKALHKVQRANQKIVARAELQQPRNEKKRQDLNCDRAAQRKHARKSQSAQDIPA